jgi:hypothetical protein
METRYAAWIAANVTANGGGTGYGQCEQATKDMAAAFPELRRVRGHYYDLRWGERAHWWLVAPDGSIVDPTAAQFPSAGNGHYEEWDETRAEPTGQCMTCGGYCYGGDNFCSEDCEDEGIAYYQRQGIALRRKAQPVASQPRDTPPVPLAPREP